MDRPEGCLTVAVSLAKNIVSSERQPQVTAKSQRTEHRSN